MVLIFPAAFAAVLYAIRIKEKEPDMAFAKAILVFEACVLMITNVLSIGSHLNKWSAFAAWLIITACALFAGYRMRRKLAGKRRFPALRTDSVSVRVMLVLGAMLLCVLLVGALFTVPYNYDSMTYHLARIGHWIDNGNVNYYVTNCDRQLYSPVLSEYNMLYLMLLSGGDMFCNLQQYISMLITAYYIYRTARMLGTRQIFALLGVFVFLTMPLTITQSLTTQNDLSAAMWFVLFVYFLIRFIKRETISFSGSTRREMVVLSVCLGMTVGFAFLMKVSVCASMIFFMPWVFVCCLKRKDRWKDMFLAACTALLAMAVTISETLVRTYLACGSFFADATSGDIMVATKNVSYIIVNLLKNFSLLITQHFWTALNGFVYRIAISVGALLHVEVNNVAISFHGFDFITYLNTGDDMYSHDRTPSAFAAYFALLSGVLLLVALVYRLASLMIRRRAERVCAAAGANPSAAGADSSAAGANPSAAGADSFATTQAKHGEREMEEKERETGLADFSAGFVISAWLGFGFIMALLRWQPWGSRLMYPALAVTVIASVHILDAFCGRIPHKAKEVIVLCLALLSFVLCIKPLDYNMKPARTYLASGCENRTKRYFTYNKRFRSYSELMGQVEQIGAKDIGVVISGDGYDYPLWKMFRDSYPQGKLRHIIVDDSAMTQQEITMHGVNFDGENAMGKAKTTEPPECILWIERGRLAVGDTLTYYGETYTCVYVVDSDKTPDSLLVRTTRTE